MQRVAWLTVHPRRNARYDTQRCSSGDLLLLAARQSVGPAHSPLAAVMAQPHLLEHLLENISGAPGSGEQGDLCFWTPQVSYYVKPLLSTPRGIADLSNTVEETQSIRQNVEAEEYVPNKGIMPEKVLNEMEVSNLPVKDFKVMIIKGLAELGKELMLLGSISTKR